LIVLREFERTLDIYCEGSEVDKNAVKIKTGEDYHIWLEGKVKRAREMEKAIKKQGKG
jgi:hypothetical protein